MASASEIVSAIDTAILTAMSNGGVASLSVGGRSVSYNLEQLQKLRKFYADIDTNIDNSDQVPFRFVNLKTTGANK